jgi:beta-phosphoglucomutase-like phosphatase (HAD superfamily)
MIQAILFDMDGLLVDSEPYWDEARKMLANEAGLDWDWNMDDQKAVMGSSTHEWVEYVIRRFKLDMPPETVEGKIIANMARLYRRQVPFLPGAIASVNLAANNFRTGLASSSPIRLIQAVTGNRALKGKFEVTLSGDHVSQGKPAPDIYLAAARALGVRPEHCVCFEDSGNGILAGKAAGMRVIAVPDHRFSPATETLARADLVLASLEELTLETFNTIGTRRE